MLRDISVAKSFATDQAGDLARGRYQRLLDEVAPDHVHIMVDGRIVASGGMELAAQLESDGYEAFR